MLTLPLFRTSPSPSELEAIPTWRAAEMATHADGGPFNPYDATLPSVATVKIHGQVEIVAGKPTDYTFEYQPDDPLDRIYPVSPGFGGVKLSSGPFSNAMARLGMATLTYEPIRADDRSVRECLTDPHAIHVQTIDAVVDDLQQTMGFELSTGEDGPKAIIIAHSMGGEPALRYAELRHETSGAVILLATIGFGSPNVRKIIQKVPFGAPSSIREEIIPFLGSDELDLSFAGACKALGYYVANIPRTIGEIGSCLTSKQLQRVHRLRALGVATVYGQPVFDLLVQGAEGARDAVDIVGDIERAGHMFVQAKPGRAAHWVRGAVNALELADLG